MIMSSQLICEVCCSEQYSQLFHSLYSLLLAVPQNNKSWRFFLLLFYFFTVICSFITVENLCFCIGVINNNTILVVPISQMTEKAKACSLTAIEKYCSPWKTAVIPVVSIVQKLKVAKTGWEISPSPTCFFFSPFHILSCTDPTTCGASGENK